MISVIIPESENNTYLTRCINSLKKQTYEDTEILFLGASAQDVPQGADKFIQKPGEGLLSGIRMAIAASAGEYIFFMSPYAVISPDTLCKLKEAGPDTFLYTQEMAVDSSLAASPAQFMLSPFGILFSKKRLLENGIEFKTETIAGAAAFTAGYISTFDFAAEASCFLYEEKNAFLEADSFCETQDLRDIFETVRAASQNIRLLLNEGCALLIRHLCLCSSEIMNLAQELIHECYEVNYECALPFIKVSWQQAVQSKDQKAYDEVRNYILKYENEALSTLLLRAIDLDADCLCFLKVSDVNQALYMINENIRLKNRADTVYDAKKAQMEDRNGLLKIDDGLWLYLRYGRIARGFYGAVFYNNAWWYVEDGMVNFEYAGLAKSPSGWVYMKNGTTDKKFTGLVVNENGLDIYIKNGIWDNTFTGAAKRGQNIRYLTDGILDRAFRGLVQLGKGDWVYIQDGTVSTSYIGLAQREGQWWYVKNGSIDFTYSGFAPGEDGWYLVEKGLAICRKDPDEVRGEYIKEEVLKRTKSLEATEKKNPLEESLSYYAQGKLGFRAILKSLGAWLGYKTGKKGQGARQ